MNDDELEESLRRAAELLDPVPVSLVEVAVEAFRFRTVDAELAELTFDSLAGTAAVRGPAQARVLGFGGPETGLDLEITGDGPSRRVVGQVTPAAHAVVEVRGGDPVSVSTDAFGRFTVDRVPPGPLSFRCRVGDAVFTTEWVTV
ncbi:hypothetical protein GCM10023194_49750 [Planotetraspora phitsanulokensis]|uniref:Carboxypeptidase regulatory-like domain-containing protein n=1 Tax=Planotetraspora phitsanulokensis TaxID=575192 RepID=A0A8J3U4B1_9ACTN|nr:hypothetical protein [Planotetraspora phitsanulokensis]GII36946.1 hypothetical protein Pph01_19490 [Planotetraspora phitsanulokensis]